MQYWDEVVDAATLTGWARAEQELADADALARFVPNLYHDDINVAFTVGADGLLYDAAYRAYDAEPEMSGGEQEEEVVLRLPAVSNKEKITEYRQLRVRSANGPGMENAIRRTMRRTVRRVSNTTDRQRAVVLVTGRATVNQRNFRFDDNFGRHPDLTATAPTLWTDTSADRLSQLKAFRDVQEDHSEGTAGVIVMDRDAFAAFSAGDQFQQQLTNGASRPMSDDEIRSFAVAAGLPPIEVYNRRTPNGPILPSGTVLLLPAPVDPNDPDATDLGATFWGTPLSSFEEQYEIPDGERPGIVAIAEKSPSVPHIAQVTADSISLPVLAHPNLSAALTVL